MDWRRVLRKRRLGLKALRSSVHQRMLVTIFVAAMAIATCLNFAHAAPSSRPVRQMSHSTWTAREGAPGGISALAQTTDGFLWLATLSGLYRFDGLRFSAFIPPLNGPQLPSLDISALAADSNNGLWMGFRVGGVGYLKGGQFTNYGADSGIVMDYVAQIVARPDGSVWAVAGGRLMRLISNHWEDVGAQFGLSSGGVQSCFFDREGTLWVADEKRLWRVESNAGRAVPLDEEIKAVTQFAQASDGTIWIADGWRSVRPILTPHAEALTVPIRGTANIVIDSHGDLWIANDYTGLRVAHIHGLDDKKQTAPAPAVDVETFGHLEGLTSNESRGILEDREGNVWVGTGLGIDRFQQSNFVPYTDVPLKSFPGLAAGSDGTVWIGGLGASLLAVRDGKTTEYGKKRGTGPIYLDHTGTLWQYDYWSHGILGFHGRNEDDFERLPLPPEHERTVAQCITGDRNGNLFVSFEHDGIWRWDGAQWEKLNAPGLPESPPTSLLFDSSGRLWAGYADGSIVAGKDGIFRARGTGRSSSSGSVMTLYEGGGLIWAGGTNGLSVFGGEGFHKLFAVEGIALRGISGIVESQQGDLWLNGVSGIVHLSAQEVERAIRDPESRMEAEVFDFRDGVIGTPAQLRPTPTAVRDSEGKLWFATAGNVVWIDPASIRRSHTPPLISIESVRSEGGLREFNGASELSIGARNLQIEYVGLNLTSPQRVIYRYKLEGEDRDWQDVGMRRQAYYTALRPGRYRFHVASSTGDGRWSELALPADIVVPPAFYQTTWFAAACAMGFAAMLLLSHRLRVRQLTARIQERLEERAAERVRIARDLHDTLLQGIQGLMLRFHFAAQEIPDSAPARHMMEEALSAADRVIEEGRERVRGLRSEGLNERDLAQALAKVGADLNCSQGVQFTVSTEGICPSLNPLVQDELYFIGREAITNAFRHAEASAIDIEISANQKSMRLLCRDDGRGIDPTILRGGKTGHWGLLGMRERAAKIGAQLDCWSIPDQGTEVVLSLPLRSSLRNVSKTLARQAG